MYLSFAKHQPSLYLIKNNFNILTFGSKNLEILIQTFVDLNKLQGTKQLTEFWFQRLSFIQVFQKIRKPNQKLNVRDQLNSNQELFRCDT